MVRDSTLARTTTLSAWLCEVARFTDETPSAPPLAVGDRVLGRYDVRRLLGRGGMGFVYDVFDRERGCSCALKTVRELGPERIVMLKNEFRAIARVRHPNLVRPGELLEDRGRWFFTMEIVEGHDPFEWVGGDPDRLRYVIGSVADVLAAMHAHGVVHRDIKPSNILVGEGDRVVVIDLGLARDRAHPLWFEDGAAGTHVYMPPDQLAGTHPIDPAADLYALGVVLHEIATGERPGRSPARGLPADLAKLCAALLDADPHARPAARTVAAQLQYRPRPVATPSPSRVFVGRDHELARLHVAYQRVVVGGPAAVFVHGPSGIGKTALVETFLAELASQGARVFAGRCHERETVPYKALDGIIDAIADALARDRRSAIPPTCAALGHVFPALAALAAIPGFVRGEVTCELPAALVELLACFSGPCVLFVDDLQWADHDGLSVLARMLDESRLPIMLVATSRHPERPAALAPLANAESIDLGPLSSDDSLRLARLLAREDVDRALLEGIAGDSGGHPLLIREASRLVTSTRDLDGAIAQRVDELGAAARIVLELVVIAGGPLPFAVLAAACDLTQLEHHVHLLETEQLARMQGCGAVQAIDTFHDRVREAVRARLSPARQRELHGRLVDGFEQVQPTAHAALAVHAAGAGWPRRDRALHHARLAADAATASGAHAHAAELLAVAIEQATSAERQALRVARARSLARAWLPAKAARAYAEAADGIGPDARRLHVLAVEQWLQAGDLERGLVELARALRAVNIRPPRRALSAVGYAVERHIQLRLPRLGRRGPPLEGVDVDALWSAASMLAMSDALLALGYHGRALRAAREVGDPARLGRSLALEACIQAGTGSFAESARLCAAAEQLVGDDPVAFNVRGAHIVLEVQLGRWREALARARTEVAEPNVWSNAAFQLYTSHCELNLGRFVELADRGDRVRRQIHDRDDRYLELASSVAFLPVVDLVRDEPVRARRTVARGRQLLWPHGRGYFHSLAAIAELFVELYAGDHARALAIWHASNTLLVRKSHYGRVYLTYLGACAALGSHRVHPRRETRELAVRAIRRLVRDPVPWAAPYGAVLRAQLAHLDDEPVTRDRVLALARAGFAAFGAEHMVDLVDRRTEPAADNRLKLRGIARPGAFSAMYLPGFG